MKADPFFVVGFSSLFLLSADLSRPGREEMTRREELELRDLLPVP